MAMAYVDPANKQSLTDLGGDYLTENLNLQSKIEEAARLFAILLCKLQNYCDSLNPQEATSAFQLIRTLIKKITIDNCKMLYQRSILTNQEASMIMSIPGVNLIEELNTKEKRGHLFKVAGLFESALKFYIGDPEEAGKGASLDLDTSIKNIAKKIIRSLAVLLFPVESGEG
jgi:hypothetical protein